MKQNQKCQNMLLIIARLLMKGTMLLLTFLYLSRSCIKKSEKKMLFSFPFLFDSIIKYLSYHTSEF